MAHVYKDILGSAPYDVQLQILSYIEDYREIIRWTRVSKTWREFINSPYLEPLYLQLIRQHWPKVGSELKRRLTSENYNVYILSYRDIVSTLGRNAASIRAGQLHEFGSFTLPRFPGNTKFCYSDGFIVVYSAERIDGVRDSVIYVYDVSILRRGALEIPAWRIVCPGILRDVALDDGCLAYLCCDLDDEEKISISLQDLITGNTRTCTAKILNLDGMEFSSIMREEGPSAFTNPRKGRSSQPLRFPTSPNLICTNGKLVVFSASLLTHVTVWDMSDDLSPEVENITGKTFILDEYWNKFLTRYWEYSSNTETLCIHPRKYYMSIDSDGDIYTVINGYMEARDSMETPSDRFFLRYAIRKNGKPIWMKARTLMPPMWDPELNDRALTHVARRLDSFTGAGGQNFFAFNPELFREFEWPEYSRLMTGSILDERYPRLVLDMKQPRLEDKDSYIHPEDFLDTGDKYDPDVQYSLNYLGGRRVLYMPPKGHEWNYKSIARRIIPTADAGCVVWHCFNKRVVAAKGHDGEVAEDEEGAQESVIGKKIRIVGLKPMVIPGETREEYDDYGEGESMEDVKWVLANRPQPASVCEFEVEGDRFGWGRDYQYIIGVHCTPGNTIWEEERPAVGDTVRLFRYGVAAGDPVPLPSAFRTSDMFINIYREIYFEARDGEAV
ncbi:hypothetical protein H072_873 [Dactylellina haptotyla CBS 200.50]|uniref:F-box domain-containing protein n=1 Tax=Dactylellina haptotyla (strain CBS 200.50) TaxID=1284197 RepID=S8AQJ1_DACHA|nr:hypothetical protein H072_873 [Dactylellina haptotyla CBS 200.50]